MPTSMSAYTMTTKDTAILTTNIIAVLLSLPSFLNGQTTAQSANEQAIRASAAAYRETFNRGDAKALADLWTEHGENIDQTGHILRGREAIAAGFEKFFRQHKGASIEITIQSIEFPRENIAVEVGTTKTSAPGVESAVDGHYSAVHVKTDGQWLLQRVNEGPPLPPSNYEHLKELEWLVGTWMDDVSGHDQQTGPKTPVVHTTCRWSVNRNFLIRKFTSTLNGQVTGTGVQHIGWYAPTKQIRSWTFDSRGHIIAGVWVTSGDHWTVKTSEALPSGDMVSGTETLSRKDQNTQIWRSAHRTPDGKTQQHAVVVKRYHAHH